MTIPIMLEYGINCIGCAHADFETIKEATHCNGIVDLEGFIAALETAIQSGAQPVETEIRTFCCKETEDCQPEAVAA